MGMRKFDVSMTYWVYDEEENNLIIDAAVSAVIEARAVAQSLIMTSTEHMPPPEIKVEINLDGVMTEIDPDAWQAARAAEQEEASDA